MESAYYTPLLEWTRFLWNLQYTHSPHLFFRRPIDLFTSALPSLQPHFNRHSWFLLHRPRFSPRFIDHVMKRRVERRGASVGFLVDLMVFILPLRFCGLCYWWLSSAPPSCHPFCLFAELTFFWIAPCLHSACYATVLLSTTALLQF